MPARSLRKTSTPRPQRKRAAAPAPEAPDRVVGEFWTVRQRQMHSLHYVVSYRASFKPELPQYFIREFSKPGDRVLDPFGGRGTTVLQANLMERFGAHNDVNPISTMIARAKSLPFAAEDVEARLKEWNLSAAARPTARERDLLVFYHPDTLRELINLRKAIAAQPDDLSRYIQVVALSRLHGHSNGFFSVYSFPQISVPVQAQARINKQRKQAPEYRPLAPRIVKKARQIVKSGKLDMIREFGGGNAFLIGDSRDMKPLDADSIDLIVTSPPFLDKVDYVQDNWLKCWFLGIPLEDLRRHIVQTRDLDEWRGFMRDTLRECARVLKPGARAVVEVGEVEYKKEMLNLDEVLASLAGEVELSPEKVFIHKQKFTKLANCFNVDNNRKGTNTHRCIVFRKTA